MSRMNGNKTHTNTHTRYYIIITLLPGTVVYCTWYCSSTIMLQHHSRLLGGGNKEDVLRCSRLIQEIMANFKLKRGFMEDGVGGSSR